MHYDNLVLDEERALYGLRGATVANCRFAGPADGESALKECRNIYVEGCEFSLRYPLWHDDGLKVINSNMDVNARAAVWYSKNGSFENCKLGGIKVFRECGNLLIKDCDISSFESCWRCADMTLDGCRITSEYFMLASHDFKIRDCDIEGKYPFQYTQNGVAENCAINFKDAFWHAKNVTLKNCRLSGEYLGWYSEGLTLINCVIDGTQPLCYCKNLKLVNCSMPNCDLAFELSEVQADIKGGILSVRSPLSGEIVCDGPVKLVEDVVGYNCTGKITIR